MYDIDGKLILCNGDSNVEGSPLLLGAELSDGCKVTVGLKLCDGKDEVDGIPVSLGFELG